MKLRLQGVTWVYMLLYEQEVLKHVLSSTVDVAVGGGGHDVGTAARGGAHLVQL